MLCQKQAQIVQQINQQVNYVFQIVTLIREELRALIADKSFCCQALLILMDMENLIPNYGFFDDQDLSEGSFQTVYHRRNYADTIGIGQYQSENQSASNIYDQIQNSMQISQEYHPDDSKGIVKQQNLIRGPYRRYTINQKLRVIQLRRIGKSYTFISKILNIPQKNIVRWCKHGILRKQGAGRKIGDIEMQKKVLQWLKLNYGNDQPILAKQIRKKAMEYSTKEDFKSSKGWLKNFINRYRLNQKHTIL